MQTIDAFDKEFPTDEACKNFLVSMRWPDGVRCPRCKSKERNSIRSRLVLPLGMLQQGLRRAARLSLHRDHADDLREYENLIETLVQGQLSGFDQQKRP
jgi:hypothetical protein